MGNRLISSCLLEIFLCISFLIFSIVIWKNIDLSYYQTIAKSYETYTVAQK